VYGCETCCGVRDGVTATSGDTRQLSSTSSGHGPATLRCGNCVAATSRVRPEKTKRDYPREAGTRKHVVLLPCGLFSSALNVRNSITNEMSTSYCLVTLPVCRRFQRGCCNLLFQNARRHVPSSFSPSREYQISWGEWVSHQVQRRLLLRVGNLV
jgi:hypothetical protein